MAYSIRTEAETQDAARWQRIDDERHMTPSPLGCILLVSINAAPHSSKRQAQGGGLRYGLARGGTASLPIVIATDVESGFGFLLTSTILYLVALLLLVYNLSEHALITYAREIFNEYSSAAHFISAAIRIAVLLPVKSCIERAVEGYFAHKTLEF